MPCILYNQRAVSGDLFISIVSAGGGGRGGTTMQNNNFQDGVEVKVIGLFQSFADKS